MIRSGTRPSLPRALAAFALLTGLAVSSPMLHAQSTTATAATPNPAIFSDPSGSVVFAGNFKHYTADDAMTHGYLALSLSPSGKVTGTLTWHGSKAAISLKGKMDVATGQGHFSQRDANGKKLANAVQIPFLVNKYGDLLSGGGTTGTGDSNSFLLSKHYDGSGFGDDSSGSLTLSGGNSYTGGVTINGGSVIAYPGLGSNGGITISNPGNMYTPVGTGGTLGGGGIVVNPTGTPGTTVIVTGTGTAAPAVVDGNLVYNGYTLLNGPLIITTNSAGSTVYTGTNSSGVNTTVTVLDTSAVSTGG